jgi:hypothetical protein
MPPPSILDIEEAWQDLGVIGCGGSPEALVPRFERPLQLGPKWGLGVSDQVLEEVSARQVVGVVIHWAGVAILHSGNERHPVVEEGVHGDRARSLRKPLIETVHCLKFFVAQIQRT